MIEVEELMKQVPDELVYKLPLWRLVADRVVSLSELQEYYTLDDIAELTYAINLNNAISEIANRPDSAEGQK